MRGQSTEFKKLMSLEFLRKADVVEIVKAVDGIPKCLVVFFLDEQVIVCIVNGLNIKLMENIKIGTTMTE
jgi:hypothetical protein